MSTGDPMIDAYLRAGGGASPFLSTASVVLRCQQHGVTMAGLYETELGTLVAVGDTFDGDAPEAARQRARGLKLPAGWSLNLRVLDDLDASERLGMWCHVGGRVEVTSSELRTMWANRNRTRTARVRHVAT